MFHKPVKIARQGDRVGMCLAGLDAKLVERGVASTPGSVPTLSAAVALVRKIRYYRSPVKSGTKMHVTIGHTTVLATVTFFGHREVSRSLRPRASKSPSTLSAGARAGGHIPTIGGHDAIALSLGRNDGDLPQDVPFDWGKDYAWQDEIVSASDNAGGNVEKELGNGPVVSRSDLVENCRKCEDPRTAQEAPPPNKSLRRRGGGNHRFLQWALLKFDTPVCAPLNSLFIASRLDTDVNTTSCRIAFYGRLTAKLEVGLNQKAQGPLGTRPLSAQGFEKLRIFKMKTRVGAVARLGNAAQPVLNTLGGRADDCHDHGQCVGARRYHDILGKDLFKRETDMKHFIGRKVVTQNGGHIGTIEGAFGQSGKFKVVFHECAEDKRRGVPVRVGEKLVLPFKRYIYDEDKYMYQDSEALSISPLELGKDEASAPSPASSSEKSSHVSEICTRELLPTNSTEGSDWEQNQPTTNNTKAKVMPLPPRPKSSNTLRSTAVPFEPPLPFSAAATTATASNTTASTIPAADTVKKIRTGVVSKLKGSATSTGLLVIVEGLFDPAENIRTYEGMTVVANLLVGPDSIGEIKGPFGKGGKCRVSFGLRSGVAVGMRVVMGD